MNLVADTQINETQIREHDAWMVSDHIVLRPVCQDDLELLRSWYNDPVNFPYMGRTTPLTVEDQRHWFYSLANDPASRAYAVEERKTCELLGSITLRNLSDPAKHGEIGILMGHPSSGYGSEAIRAVLQYAFVHLGLRCVSLEVRGDNTRAITCYMRAGFRPEGVLRRRLLKSGVLWDLYSLSIFPEEFFAQVGG